MERTVQDMDLAERKAALSQLGRVMALVGQELAWPGHSCGLTEDTYIQLDSIVRRAQLANGWFTEANVRHAFMAWAQALVPDALNHWLSAYPSLGSPQRNTHTVGLVLAGNIPLVGLHDVLCVWLSGHRAKVKCSSQDSELIPALLHVLDEFHVVTSGQVEFRVGELGAVDAIIATGSNNTARYFEHYFGHLPRIVRKSRVSVALLDGTETQAELAALGEDIFRYFGLGCRNVSKLFVPADFELDRFFEAMYPWNSVVHHNKYGNNYDYTRALWLLDGIKFLDNGFMLLREDGALASPVSAVHYERYADPATALAAIGAGGEHIQCVVGHGHLAFGSAQQPSLGDYADGVDTMRFLLSLG